MEKDNDNKTGDGGGSAPKINVNDIYPAKPERWSPKSPAKEPTPTEMIDPIEQQVPGNNAKSDMETSGEVKSTMIGSSATKESGVEDGTPVFGTATTAPTVFGAANQTPAGGKPKKSKKMLVIIIAAAAVLITGIVILLVLLLGGNKNLSLDAKEIVFGKDTVQTAWGATGKVKPVSVESCGDECVLQNFGTVAMDDMNDWDLEEDGFEPIDFSFGSSVVSSTVGKKSSEDGKYLSIKVDMKNTKDEKANMTIEYSKKSGNLDDLKLDLGGMLGGGSDEDKDYGDIEGTYVSLFDTCDNGTYKEEWGFDGEGNVAHTVVSKCPSDGNEVSYNYGSYELSGKDKYTLSFYGFDEDDQEIDMKPADDTIGEAIEINGKKYYLDSNR